jgi:hypothetical protein
MNYKMSFQEMQKLGMEKLSKQSPIGEGAEQKVYEHTDANFVIKYNDYYHPELGIIIEDLHDENVLTEEGVLQFIDTIFYLTPSFFE